MSKPNTYHELSISNTQFTDIHTIKFPWTATKLLIMNDSLVELLYSFNGRDIDGKLLWDDASHELTSCSIGRIWLKVSGVETAKVRVFGWGNA